MQFRIKLVYDGDLFRHVATTRKQNCTVLTRMVPLPGLRASDYNVR